MNDLLGLIVSVGSPLLIAGQFWVALKDPMAHEAFIAQTGGLAFAMEFISLHAASILAGFNLGPQMPSDPMEMQVETILKIVMIGVYALFMIGLLVGYHNWIAPLLFVVSMATQAFGARLTGSALVTTYLRWPIFFAALVAIIVWESQIAEWFPWPASLLNPASDALFDKTPQTAFVWGVLYFGLSALLALIVFLVKGKNS